MVTNKDVHCTGYPPGQVCVKVQGGYDGHIGACGISDGLKQTPGGVVVVFGRHSAVHGHQHAVHREGFPETVQDIAREPVVGPAANRLAGGPS